MRSLLVVSIIAACTTPALADLQWRSETRPYIEARSDEPESDASLRMTCMAPNVEVRLGADVGVGKGEHDAVSLVLESKGQKAELTGKSEPSVDAQMTGGNELVTFVDSDDALFAVLGSGGDVKVTGSISSPAVWPAKGMKAAVEKFLAACAAVAH